MDNRQDSRTDCSPIIAVTCDDGWCAPGFASLIQQLQKGAFEIVAAGPLKNWVSYGTATGMQNDRHANRERSIGADNVTGLDAPPAGVSRFLVDALQEREKRHAGTSDLSSCLVAGVNSGPNVGGELIHSGTFGAALTAFWNGIAAVAISLDDFYSVDETNPGTLQFEMAAIVAHAAVEWVLKSEERVLCNINVPNSATVAALHLHPASPSVYRETDGSPWVSDQQALRDGFGTVSVFAPYSLRPDHMLSQNACGYISSRFSILSTT